MFQTNNNISFIGAVYCGIIKYVFYDNDLQIKIQYFLTQYYNVNVKSMKYDST